MTEAPSNTGFCEIIKATGPQSNLTGLKTISGCLPVVVHEEMYYNNMYFGLAYVISFFLLALGLGKISLKNTLTYTLILDIFCALILQHITNSGLLLLVFCVFIVCCGVSIPLVNATAVDLFPTQLRGMAISMSILIGRMGTVTGANTIGFLLEINCSNTFYGMAGIGLGEVKSLI